MPRDDPLDQVYDAETLAAVDRWARPRRIVPEETAGGWRRGVGGAAVLTAAMLGVREALDPTDDEPIIEEIDLHRFGDPREAVSIFFVPGAPRLTRVLCRPWRLSVARGV